MAGISISTFLLAALLLVVPVTSTPLPIQPDGGGAVVDKEATTTDPSPSLIPDAAAADHGMQADEPPVAYEVGDDDDEDMRGRMAYLILSLWDEDLQGLEGLDERAYRLDLPEQSPRRRRDIVFRPLWVTKERSARARTRRLQQRYWDERRRYQRFGRDVDSVVSGPASPGHRQRERRSSAATLHSMSDAAVLAPPAAVSRVRRQWAFRPLFASRQATERKFRGRRAVEDGVHGGEAASGASAVRRQWASRPLFASHQRAARRRQYRQRRGASSSSRTSRRRREWVDVPLFAVKQIEASRIREEEEVTHPHHRAQKRNHQEYGRQYEDYYGGNYRGLYRPYRDYYRDD